MSYRPIDRVFEPAALSPTMLVPLAALKEHLRVFHTRDNANLTAYILAAQGIVERSAQRLLSPRPCVLRLNALPCASDPVELPGGAVASITSVTVDGTPVTGCLAFGDSPARLYPAAPWPAVVGTVYPVVISYVAGYATPPDALLAAVKMIAGELSLHRETSTTEKPYEVSYAADSLIALHRIRPI